MERAAFEAGEDNITRVGITRAFVTEGLKMAHCGGHLRDFHRLDAQGQPRENGITFRPIPPIFKQTIDHQVFFDLHVALHGKRLSITMIRIFAHAVNEFDHAVFDAFGIDILVDLLHAEHIRAELCEQVQESCVLIRGFFRCAAEILDAPAKFKVITRSLSIYRAVLLRPWQNYNQSS